jgi:hypothetical protein
MDFSSLPGAGLHSAPALLVAIGAPRLRELGIDVPSPFVAKPEHALYALLAESAGNAAHSQYNALIRRLVSFERALACASRGRPRGPRQNFARSGFSWWQARQFIAAPRAAKA